MRNLPRLSIASSRSSLDRHLRHAVAHLSEFVRARTLRRLAAGLAAAAAIAVSGAAEVSSLNTEQAEAANTVRNLGPNALKKLCVKTGLKMPIMKKFDDNYALGLSAVASSDHQFWNVNLRESLVPADCDGKYMRFVSGKPEVQNPNNHKQWFSATRPKWNFLMASNQGVKGDPSDPNYSDSLYSATNQFIVDKSSKLTRQTQLYRCTPGKATTSARMKLKHKVKDLKTGEIVGSRTRTYSAFVGPRC